MLIITQSLKHLKTVVSKRIKINLSVNGYLNEFSLAANGLQLGGRTCGQQVDGEQNHPQKQQKQIVPHFT